VPFASSVEVAGDVTVVRDHVLVWSDMPTVDVGAGV
jgi:hypothetical protein